MNESREDRHESLGPQPSSTVVEAWLRRADGLAPAERFALFESAFVALWERARVPLGGITLVAGVDRVLVHARERFPGLGEVSVTTGGIEFAALRARAHLLAREELGEIFRFLLVEFLGLLGSLTGEMLTPALHATLSARGPGTEPRDQPPAGRRRETLGDR